MVSVRVVVGAVVLLALVVAGGSVIAVADSHPVTGEAGTASGTAGETTTVTVEIENTGSSAILGVSLQLQSLPDGFGVVDTRGDGAYSASEQAFVYLSIGPGERVSSTITLEIDGCVARGSYQLEALLADSENQPIQQLTPTVEVQPRDNSDGRQLGPNDRRNCVVNPTAPASFPRDCVPADRPAIVYTGERIGVEAVPQSDRNTSIGTGETRFVGIGGPAEGDAQPIEDASSVNFQTFALGQYSTDDTGPNATPELIVRDPSITDFALHTRPGRGGVEVTDGQITQGFPTVYLNPRYNFDEAGRLRITVRNPEGLDITDRVLADDEDRFVTASSQDTTLNFSDSGVGAHTVTVEGDRICPTATTSLNITDDQLAVSAPETVTRGQNTVINISGQPGTAAHIRIPAGAVATDEAEVSTAARSVTAGQLFTSSGDIDREFYDASANTYVATVRQLNSDGQGRVQLRTDQLKPDTLQIRSAPGADPSVPVADTADLTIEEAALTLDRVPPTVNAQEEFTLRGQAERGDEFGAYVRVSDSWHRVPRTDEPTGTSGDRYQLNLSATGPLTIPGDYRVAVARDVIVDGRSFPARISETEWRRLDRSNATLLRIRPPELQLSVANPTLAHNTADESVVEGQTVAETVRLYRVTPTGDVHTTAISVDNGTFSHELAPETRGTHRLVVVAPGRDGAFVSSTPSPPAAAAPSQAVTLLVTHHTEAGRDDLVQTMDLMIEDPSVAVTPRYTTQQLQIRGTTNRANGTLVFIRLQTTPRPILTNATIQDGRFERNVSLSRLDDPAQTITVVVTVGELTRRVTPEHATPTGTSRPQTPAPSQSPTGRQSDVSGSNRRSPTPAVDATSSATSPTTAATITTDPTPATTGTDPATAGRGPGYGVVVGTVAILIAVGLLAVRRR